MFSTNFTWFILEYIDPDVHLQRCTVKFIEINLNYDFNNLCEWFIDNKLSIHFREDKTKSILSKRGNKSNLSLNITRNKSVIKQHSVVEYLGCLLDKNMSGEAMARTVLKKVNGKKKFLYRQSRYLPDPLKSMLCNTLIQSHYDFACCSWYRNLSMPLKTKLETTQNSCIIVFPLISAEPFGIHIEINTSL